MRSDLVLLLTIVGASLLSNNVAIDAAPVHRLLSKQQPSQQPSPAGRTQIKPQSYTASSSSSSSRTPSRRHPVFKSLGIHNVLPAAHNNPSPWYFNSDRRPRSYSAHSLEGHAVLDEEDDDAGNELLDTETDDLMRPDDDDTIEGEVLEEEGDDDNDLADDRGVENTHFQAKFTLPQIALKQEDGEKWVQENGIQEGDLTPESFEDEEELINKEADKEIVVVLSKFGGNTAAADLAAEEP
ncbi:hypothetical protein BGX27_010574 [Mortierella sp. AM989]|nr:hypothetical protein BGX27_010574 [Mortierella sp. AM989]